MCDYLVESGYLYEVLVSVKSPPGVLPGLGVPVPAVAPDHLALAPHLAHQGSSALLSLGVLSPAITGSWHNTLAELGGLMALTLIFVHLFPDKQLSNFSNINGLDEFSQWKLTYFFRTIYHI